MQLGKMEASICIEWWRFYETKICFLLSYNTQDYDTPSLCLSGGDVANVEETRSSASGSPLCRFEGCAELLRDTAFFFICKWQDGCMIAFHFVR